ncbi:MAG: hypothetical protein JNM31_15720 [Flavobacteriales bacterium]|nr:hypothetical protein [Flavobacteriales bacterium]
MKTLLHSLLMLALPALNAAAQVEVDRRVELTGGTPAERLVRGLSDADTTTDALNTRIAQRGSLTWLNATGADDWQAALPVGGAPPLAGTYVDLLCPATNTGAVTLRIDTAAAHPVVKAGAQALDPGDVQGGEVLGLLFDGAHWQLLNTRRTERRPCPAGFAQVNANYCIQVQENAAADWTAAAEVCGALDARLCSWGQWYNACVKATDLGLLNMVGDWEWTNGGANADTYVRVVGFGSCTQAATSGAWDSVPRTYRCCFQR